MKRKARILFINETAKRSFESLRQGNDFERKLHKSIEKAFEKIGQDAFCGIQIPKKVFPKEYVLKYHIDTLWKYDLPSGWRRIYTLTSDGEIEIIAAILEWLPHKKYEQRFKY